jgi:hypothetical protein
MIDAEKILLINCSAPNYNLAIEKMKIYFGHKATEGRTVNDLFFVGYDAVMLSVIFSWDVPRAIVEAKTALSLGMKVMIGGGGTFVLRAHIERETGLKPYYAPVPELDAVDAKFKMVYFTRGCVEKCSFCIVPKIEGNVVKLNEKSQPAQALLDNNLSEIPSSYKEYIVEKYLSAGIRVVDANSGFEPKGIDEYTVRLFGKLPLRWWRTGFDEIGEEKQFIESVAVIKEFSKKTIRVYTMIGDEPIEECRYRCEKVISLGCEPVPQAYIKLGSKTKTPVIQHDWDAAKLRDFQRFFYCPPLWKKLKLEEYAPRINQKPIFNSQ